MENFRSSPDIRYEADIRHAVATEILLSIGTENFGDIAILWNINRGTLGIAGDDLEMDAGLRTAVALSLFTDDRADEDDELPAGETNPRGWWGNNLNQNKDRLGSKLWLLQREKQTREVVNRAREYSQSALQWMVEDRVAASVGVDAYIFRPGWLWLDVDIVRPARNALAYRYEYNWLSHEYKQGA